MQQFAIVPKIYYFDTFADFVKEIPLTEKDLIVTNEWIYKPYIEPLKTTANVLYQESFGAGEPSDEMVDAVVREAAQYDYDRIIAVGGGTVIDICKLMALKQPEKTLQFFNGEASPERDKELIIVPTTCGTGSEVTNVSVMALVSMNTKKGLASDEMYASKAVLIPESLQGLPDKVFATSAIDALIHATESYLSPKATPFSEMFSLEAIRMLVKGFRGSVAAGNNAEARKPYLKDFALASNYAGIAFGNAGCGPVHAMSYAHGGAFHIAHGESTYLIFTDVLKKYLELKPDGEKLLYMNRVYAELLDTTPNKAYEALDALLSKMIEKKPLHTYGMTEEQITAFAKSTIDNQQRLMSNQYVPLTEADVADIYRKVF